MTSFQLRKHTLSSQPTTHSTMSEHELDKKALEAALRDARARGLPEGWTVKLDKRHRRKWISPTGKSCDSIPKAIAISIELGLLPPDTPIPKIAKATTAKKRSATKSPAGSTPKKAAVGPPRPSTPEAIAFTYNSDEEDPGSETDPETSLDVTVRRDADSSRPMTVHWDATSPDGRKVGWRVRLWDENSNKWEDGRIIRYDPYTHKHKIRYERKPRKGERVDKDNCVWVRLVNEVYQCATRLVWAHVKGFAWWPALTQECNPPTFGSRTYKKGWELVAFFGSDEVATLRDIPECIRPFGSGKVDSVILMNKKKRNADAIKLACEEEIKIQQVRNEASRFYAEKAFGLVNNLGMNLLGKKVQVFRGDVNYPYGETVVGRVRQYSAETGKWLVTYDLSERMSIKYDPSWVNFKSKDCDYKLLDKKTPNVPTNEDLVPFMHGFVALEPKDGMHDDEGDDDWIMTRLLTERCRGCVDYVLQNQSKLTCEKCGGCFHPGCADPPVTPKALQRIVESTESWVCAKCTTCRGCYQRDIGFGAHGHALPSSVSLPDGETLNLCSTCTLSYEKKRYCPNCAHTWDDARYQKVQRQIRWQEKMRPLTKGRGCKGKRETAMEAAADDAQDGEDDSKVNPAWFYPDSSVWGYTEEAMLLCECCKLWVHAACGGLTEEEYEQTSDGDHPIYSKEFLCRVCCKRRCKELIDELKAQDSMMLFAAPVTEQMAPTYHDVIKNPMDLQTMSERAEKGDYLNHAWVRENFELMVLNALTFNQVQSKWWHEAKRYHQDCLKKVFSVVGKAAPPGAYSEALHDCIEKGEKAIQSENERETKDETAEKKDLVAGSGVASITLPPLRDPPDQPSCLPFTEVKLKPTEAFYCAWMECCFTCGSSGAADTLLFCVDCGESFHSFCVGAPIHSMDASSVSGWRCPNCKICEISGDVPKDELLMLFCDICDRAFSLDLLDPPLKAAPPGLWVCGQCVDCKECGNAMEKGGASLTYWSRDPERCYRCGGCQGLVDSKELRCVVCSKMRRAGDDSLVHCSSCDSMVHDACDPRAKGILSGQVIVSDQEHPKYECPSCRKKYGSKEQSKHIRQSLRDQAWLAVLNGALVPHDNHSLLELYEKLTDEIDWRLRNMWRDDYRSVIKEGFRLLTIATQQLHHTTDILDLFATGTMDLPAWMGQRAARFIRFAKESQWGVDGFPKKDIKSLVLVAKLAASFLKIACRAMGLKTKKTVKCYDRMMSLLKGPEELCGMVEMPMDILRVEGNRNIIQAEEWRAKFEPEIRMDGLGLEDCLGLQNRAVVHPEDVPASNSSRDDSMYKIAFPVLGWNGHIDSGDEENQWKDPRSCSLCHICGDDDAGFATSVKQDDKLNADPEIARVGRLLPISDGNWVHASCALWSSEVWEAASGGLVHAMEKARSRGAQLKCFGCGRPGATVGCFKANCYCNYHFPCAKACGAVFTDARQMFCAMHKSYATGLLPRESFEYMKPLMFADEKKIGIDKDANDTCEATVCSRIGALVVHCLGAIDQHRDGFHTEKHITPPGYVATRIFWSARAPKTRTVYVLKIEVSRDGRRIFSIIPGDDPNATIRGSSCADVYSTLLEHVKRVNKENFSADVRSKLPVPRKQTKKTYGLNGAQFFGFGLHHIRRALETLPGIEAVVAPLSGSSLSYRFCYVQPSIESVMAFQRKRAALAAEKALENSTGCARTEGMQAVAKSGGSGRITRILVRSAEEEVLPDLKKTDADKVKADRESNQNKYREMKSMPLENRLAARRSHIHGWGLFTKVDLPKNSMIVEYMGETVRQCIADKRERGYETSGIGSCYMFRLDLQHIVDATTIGCMARFMNHCCRPNAYAKVINVDTELGPEKKIVVFANREIAAGEEITYDYKFPVEDGSLRCTCGAPNCIGRMN